MALDLGTLTLQVIDNLNGTATATVGAAGAGATVGFYYSPMTVQAGGGTAWTLAGTATANGAGTAALTTGSIAYGYYLWTAARLPTATTVDALARVVFRPLVDPTDPIHNRILDAVVTAIRGLNLSGIGSDATKVFKRWVPVYLPGLDDDGTAGQGGAGAGLPMIQVAPFDRETPLGQLTGKDDVGYPVLVGMYDRPGAKLDENMPRALKWRRQVAARFRNQQLAGVPEVVLTDWKPDLIVNPADLKQNYWSSGMMLVFRSRETRGLVA